MLTKKLLYSRGPLANLSWGIANQTMDLANGLFNHVVPKVETVEVADHLARVTNIGEEEHAESVGLPNDTADKIWKSVESFYRTGMHNQIALCVRREGKIILDRSIGLAQGEYGESDTVPGNTDTPFCLFSGSKAVTSLLLCKLEEEGVFSLDDKITKFIPEFGKHGKDKITLAELIAHRARVPAIQLEEPSQIADHDYVLDLLCNAKPHSSKQAYHALTGGFIMAEVVERATGKPISAALDTYFRKPLGMKYFTYGLDKKYWDIASHSHESGFPLIGPLENIPLQVLGVTVDQAVELSNSDVFYDQVLPAGNMFSNAEECSRFYQMILNKGEYNGKQVMRAETIRKARSGDFLPSWDGTFNLPAHFSYGGFMLNTPPLSLFGIDAPRAFGHLGLINILTWADPYRKIAVGLMTSGKPFAGPHLYNFANIPNTINRYCPKLRRRR